MSKFQKDNGASIVNKTPMSMLYEALKHQRAKANYKLLFDGTGTFNPMIKYRVSALGCSALGEGRNANEAKQDASAALLKKINARFRGAEHVTVKCDESVDIGSSYSLLKDNLIHMLGKMCVANKIPMAILKLRSEQGPAHLRTYTVECKISSCTEVAVAQTKQEAKQMAAQQMINRVKDILGDKFVPFSEKIVNLDNAEEILRRIRDGTFSVDMSIPLADAHNVFFLKREELRVPEEFFNLCRKPLDYFNDQKNPKKFLENLVRKLGGICTITFSSKRAMKKSKAYTCSAKHNIENNENCAESTKASEDHIGRQTKYDGGKIMVFLTITCPQGRYVFTAIALNIDTGVKQAAGDAIEFFWMMSLPRSPKEAYDDRLEMSSETSSSSCSSKRVSYKL